jgi:hypothetical protein
MTKPFPNPTLEGYLLGPREVHEAGHVVIAEILGWPHNGITMDPAKASPLPDGAFAEREAFIPSDFHQWTHGDDHKQRVAAVYARILYAGRAAEIALLGRDCCGHALDYEHAREAIRWGRTGLYPAFRRSRDGTFVRQSIEDYVVGRTERRLEKQAAVLVRRHKIAIAMVAHALRFKTTLTGDDVRALIEDAKRRLALGALTLWPEAD